LRGIYDDLGATGPFQSDSVWSDPRSYSGPGIFGGRQWTFGPRVAGQRLLERAESPEDDRLIEEVDALKEEMTCIHNDIELVDWAKKRIFTPTTSPDGVVSYSRSYPKMLAHLLKIIRSNYHNPHLALALFHYAQTVSVESYLTGCLAPAYNELIRIRWDSFRDLEGVEAGVREMEVNGVAWDRGTQRVVSWVVEEVGREILDGDGLKIWGREVFDQLSRLEQRVQKDIADQEALYEFQQKEKRHARERQEGRRFTRPQDRGRDSERENSAFA
jgi:hypothetical protein